MYLNDMKNNLIFNWIILYGIDFTIEFFISFSLSTVCAGICWRVRGLYPYFVYLWWAVIELTELSVNVFRLFWTLSKWYYMCMMLRVLRLVTTNVSRMQTFVRAHWGEHICLSTFNARKVWFWCFFGWQVFSGVLVQYKDVCVDSLNKR